MKIEEKKNKRKKNLTLDTHKKSCNLMQQAENWYKQLIVKIVQRIDKKLSTEEKRSMRNGIDIDTAKEIQEREKKANRAIR